MKSNSIYILYLRSNFYTRELAAYPKALTKLVNTQKQQGILKILKVKRVL